MISTSTCLLFICDLKMVVLFVSLLFLRPYIHVLSSVVKFWMQLNHITCSCHNFISKTISNANANAHAIFGTKKCESDIFHMLFYSVLQCIMLF